MNDADKKIRQLAKDEVQDLPKHVDDAIKKTLEALPERKRKSTYKQKHYSRAWSKVALIAAAVVGIFIALPNISPDIALAMKNIPVLGAVAEVITFRDYNYSDNFHDAQVEIPEIRIIQNGDSGKIRDSAGKINEEVRKLTDELIERFKQDVAEIGNNGHSSLSIMYDVVTNDEDWFTLKIQVYEGAGSSNTYYKYYHIDKLTGDIVNLGDLFQSDAYKKAIEEDITRQMREQVEKDDDGDITYWRLEHPEWSYTEIEDDRNFYFKDENIVIVFDKYEVGPGSMGCPEFEINRSVFEKYLKDQYI